MREMKGSEWNWFGSLGGDWKNPAVPEEGVRDGVIVVEWIE